MGCPGSGKRIKEQAPAALLLLLFMWMQLSLEGQTVPTVALPAYELDNLIQGRFYTPNYFPIRGNPFLNKSIAPENIQLLDKSYEGLPLWYDIYADEVILMHKDEAEYRFIQLNKEQVQFF
ncbi:MAG: hypothetical protein KDD04_12035, partial [Sinomicrobium sp.]|nr:hypothetical protein [Sinomicrobium sp.]